MFFALVSSKARKLGFSAIVALLSVLGGFYYALYHLIPQAAESGRVESRRPASPRTNEQGKTKFVVQPAETETRAEATGYTKLKVLLEAEREMQVAAAARHKLCLGMAQKNFEVTWAANCKTTSEQDRTRHERCIAQVDRKAVCAPLTRTPSDTCALPVELASKLNQDLEEMKGRCGPEPATTLSQQ